MMFFCHVSILLTQPFSLNLATYKKNVYISIFKNN